MLERVVFSNVLLSFLLVCTQFMIKAHFARVNIMHQRQAIRMC